MSGYDTILHSRGCILVSDYDTVQSRDCSLLSDYDTVQSRGWYWHHAAVSWV
jgi:hypothetical protein